MDSSVKHSSYFHVQESFIRVLLGIDIIQDRLVGNLLEKITECTDEDEDVTKNNYNNNNNNNSLVTLIINQIRI